jgi:uncharacterized protein YbjT (DUF2867 family)
MRQKRTLVIGAHGKIGQLFCELAQTRKHSICAMVRSAEQREHCEGLGTPWVMGDLEADFAHALDDCTDVVFTAGSGGRTGADKTIMVDLYGALRSIEAGEQRGIEHFVMVSALRCEAPLLAPSGLRHYMVAKKLADEHLGASRLPHTILRPGLLSDEAPSGRVCTDPTRATTQSVSRANVAHCILAALESGGGNGRAIDLLDGATPITEVFSGET